MNAFEKYLLSIPLNEAVKHVVDCVKESGGDLAWNLIAKYNGEGWSCDAKDFHKFITETILKLEKDANENT